MADYHLSHEMVAGVALCEETNTSGHEEICWPSDLVTEPQLHAHEYLTLGVVPRLAIEDLGACT